MNAVSHLSPFGPSPLEARADELSKILSAGLDDEFQRQFQLAAKDLTDTETEQLVKLINRDLQAGPRQLGVKVVLSQNCNEMKTVTVMGGSRFLGNSWSIARQTFAY